MRISYYDLLKSKFVLATIVYLFTSQFSLGQDVDTIEYNGEQYFVYPFKVPVSAHTDYSRILNLKKQEKEQARSLKKMFKSGDFDANEIEELMYYMEVESGSLRKKKHFNNKFKKVARTNPYPMLQQKYTLESDIIPALDPIPDGKYVQLFEDFCLTDLKGSCQEQTNRIAGVFEIKNNALHGQAFWFDIKGDTLKSGMFQNGLKEGEWRLERRKISYSITEWDAEQYIEDGQPYTDTTIMICTYQNGAKSGLYRLYERSEHPTEEGYYDEDEKVGEWLYRNVIYQYIGNNEYKTRQRINNVVTMRYTYANIADSIIVKQPWIRDGEVEHYGAPEEVFNFDADYYLSFPRRDLFVMAFEAEEDLDLEEEHFDSYDMDSYDYGEYEYYHDYGGNYGFSRYQPSIYDEKRDESFKRGYVIDSIGMIARYQGVMEKYYSNGQLMYRYEFKDGKLLKEDTIFWDNGNAHDVIAFVADSNHYLRSIYDYDGKLFKSLVYDSLGDFDRVEYFFDDREFVIIDGFNAKSIDWKEYYYYDVEDTLDYELFEPITLYRSWNKEDSLILTNRHFDPNERVLRIEEYNVLGGKRYESEKLFSENYESWTGWRKAAYNNLELRTTSSATYRDEWEKDSIAQAHAGHAYRRFDVAHEFVLYKNGTEYSGEVQLNFDKGKFGISKSGLTVNFAKYPSKSKARYRLKKKYMRMIKKYKSKGKGADNPLLAFMNTSEAGRNHSSMIYSLLFDDLIGSFFSYPGKSYYDDWYGGGGSSGNTIHRIEGFMADGKPTGLWVGYDKENNVKIEVPFENGEANGQVKRYNYQMAAKNSGKSYDRYAFLQDSLPKKRTYYLSGKSDYKNDKLDGEVVHFDWLGEVESRTQYKEGRRHGIDEERNKLAYSKSYYKDGAMDGYAQTYLTLPDRDSMLLYDLNFQDGLLNGESKSYHLNGRLSKRGFFLDGDPIDDYEAFDSLGFRYHYVKFKYSYPVEEKIWEENQLSVRYLFNWEDSIEFVPSDITTSASLERMLVNLGFGREYVTRPYYGRPTLVEKDGIKYHMTKYYPNDTIARDGSLDDGKKVGHWKFYDYEGELLYIIDYKDSIFSLNDSIRFKSKGIFTDISPEGDTLFKAHIIEKFEKYDCSHTDHYEVRQLYTIWQANDTLNRMNGYVRNYYDNGTLQNEGKLENGLPTGVWKFYDPFGKLNQYGYYVQGKRDGRWLSGDLSKTKYLGDICLNPNLPDLEEEIKYRENLLDIMITNYKLGKAINKQYYDVNMNRFLEMEEENEVED